MTGSARQSFRAALAENAPLVTPAAHDALSARMIQHAGFKAVAISGSALVGARYGLPDLGMVGLTDMANGARDILAATDLPCSIDGDDGYGGIKNVVRLIGLYKSIGIGSVVLEDQSSAIKRPGESAVGVVPLEEVSAKLTAAVAARADDPMVIVGRTDAFLTHGMDEALRRAEHFIRCGVDGIFIAGAKEPADLEKIGRSLKGVFLQTVVTDLSGKAGPSLQELSNWGYRRVTIPSLLVLSSTLAIASSLEQIRNFSTGGARPSLSEAGRAKSIFDDVLGNKGWEEWERQS